MTISQIIANLREQLTTVKPSLPHDIPADDHFRNTWNLDSLELVEFVARIEQQFHILIPDKDLEQLYSLDSAAGYVHHRLKS